LRAAASLVCGSPVKRGDILSHSQREVQPPRSPIWPPAS
jgi:hypothetical protein